MISVRQLTNDDIAEIKSRLNAGHQVQEIALDYNINLGRISEIKHSKRGANIKPSGQGELEL